MLLVKNLVAHYDKIKALRGISLDIPKSMIVALIGANGAGKSTVLRIVSGLLKPTSGEIWFKGNRIDGLPAHAVTQLGITHVPEGRRLFSKMSVLDNLEIGSRDPKRTHIVMESVFQYFPRLRERLRQRSGTLSGGEQQMLAIGRALMAEPKLLILDEPSIGLSPVMTKGIARIIVEINHQGITIMLAEQNARLALGLSQKGYVLETGFVAIEGDTKDLINNEKVKSAYLSA
jgi:branched-chain amino acid transport system ATP-binding protein